MNTLHCELEDETLQTDHLKAKISRISNDLGADEEPAGGDDGSVSGGGNPAGGAGGKRVEESEMLYLDQAQALDMSRREEETAAARALQDVNGKTKGRWSKHEKRKSKQDTRKAEKAAEKKKGASPPPTPGAPSAADENTEDWGGEDDEDAMYINTTETKADYVAAETEWLPPPPQLFEEGPSVPTTNPLFDGGTPPPPPPPSGDGEENSYADFPLPPDAALPPPPDASDSFYQNVQETLSAAVTGVKPAEAMEAGAEVNVTVMSTMEEMSQMHYETAVAENAALKAAGFYANTTEGIYEELSEAEVPLFYRALYDYTAAQADDLSIQAGDVLYVLVARDDGWCQGLSTNGKCGFFPQSYVEKVEPQESISAEKPRIIMLTPTAADTLKVEMHPGCPPTVVEVAAGSVPESVGIRVGDCLLEVDEEPCASSSFGTVSSWLSQCESGRTLKMCFVSVARIANISSSA